jgi:hypothetical protein
LTASGSRRSHRLFPPCSQDVCVRRENTRNCRSGSSGRTPSLSPAEKNPKTPASSRPGAFAFPSPNLRVLAPWRRPNSRIQHGIFLVLSVWPTTGALDPPDRRRFSVRASTPSRHDPKAQRRHEPQPLRTGTRTPKPLASLRLGVFALNCPRPPRRPGGTTRVSPELAQGLRASCPSHLQGHQAVDALGHFGGSPKITVPKVAAIRWTTDRMPHGDYPSGSLGISGMVRS